MPETSTIFHRLKVILLCGLLVTITFSKLNLNSICIILLLVVWLAEGKFKEKMLLLKSNFLFIAFTIFTVLHFTSILYSPSFEAGWKHAETKAGFLIIPLILCSGGIATADRKRILLFFSFSVSVAAIICLV